MSEILDNAKASMDKTVENLSYNFSKVRTGRASANMLSDIVIDYYGVATPITQLAGVKSPEAHLLVVEPWDKSVLNAIEKAIHASDIGITPSNDGNVIRLPFPPPTEERRKQLVKECGSFAEEARVVIRNARRDANNMVEKLEKDGELSEDVAFREKDEIQKLTDSYISKVDALLKEKEAEVMEV